jgi:hypothetical protein
MAWKKPLSYYEFLSEHWRWLRANNPLKRIMRDSPTHPRGRGVPRWTIGADEWKQPARSGNQTEARKIGRVAQIEIRHIWCRALLQSAGFLGKMNDSRLIEARLHRVAVAGKFV